jgi:hypothetical protein
MIVDNLRHDTGLAREVQYQIVLSSYNRKASCFFEACRMYYRTYSDRKPNRNDFIDLLHFLYLTEKSSVLVSNDKMMIALATEGARIKAIEVRPFLKGLGIEGST